MGITFEEVEKNNLVPEKVLKWLPRRCECGGEIQFTNMLTHIYCSNPRCYMKVAARLEAMMKAMQVDGWGASTCVTVCKEYKMQSPFQAFLIKPLIEQGKIPADIGVPALGKKVDNLMASPARNAELWEVVKYANIPGISSIAMKIFDGFASLKEAYDEIERGQVPFIASRLGIKNMETGVMAYQVYQDLITYKMELFFGIQFYQIKNPEGQRLHIAITGGVSGFKNKQEFIKVLNERYSGKVHATLLNSVTQDTDILVADGDTSSSKFKKATKMNDTHVDGLISSGLTKEDLEQYSPYKPWKLVSEKIAVLTAKEVIERLDRVYKAPKG